MKTLLSFLAILLFSAVLFAAENPTGTWDCTATPSNGGTIKVSLVVKNADGKLAGSVQVEGGEELPISEAKVDGASFTFKIQINGEPYTIDVKLAGGKLSGKYRGSEASGTLEGTRKT
ncbi:MAG: hypothetical protein LAQ30_29385 [Acidobacteriia bacterium]|nr:hypothetical protein [Terriglobia bacterium]